MKTEKEILEYIVKQDWYGKFCKNIIKNSIKYNQGKAALCLDKNLILNAFSWARSPEDYSFWKTVNDEYIKWYITEPIVELTIEQIAEKFNVPVSNVRIKDNE